MSLPVLTWPLQAGEVGAYTAGVMEYEAALQFEKLLPFSRTETDMFSMKHGLDSTETDMFFMKHGG